MRVVIPLGCVLLMVATILSITTYGYYVNRRDTLALSDDLLKALDRRIATQVHDYLVPASEMVKLAADIVEDPAFGIDKSLRNRGSRDPDSADVSATDGF